jgi:2-polyprenyl-3-methyl-5-hydroxy-6-metoxy-1,4-benzoquinol methylase
MNTADFWDKTAPRYAARPIRNSEAYAHTLARTQSYLNAADHMLELGCGTGGTALEHAGHVARITATDISPAMIGIARAKPQPQGNITFLAATLDDGRLPDGPFDVVTGFNLLHLLPDPAAGIRSIAGLIRPGGLFISKTPCLAGRYSLLKPVIGAMRLVGKAPKVHFLSTARLEQAITQAGFEIIETGDFPKSPPSHFIVARRA